MIGYILWGIAVMAFVVIAVTILIGAIELCFDAAENRDWSRTTGVALAALVALGTMGGIAVWVIVSYSSDGYTCVKWGESHYDAATKTVRRDCLVKVKVDE